MKDYYGTLKDTDNKYDTDLKQMGTIEGIKPASDVYWLASRYVYSNSNSSTFYVHCVDTYCNLSNDNVYYVTSRGGAGSYSNANGFRPVFTLKSDIKITEGDGVDTPYRLES